jgi:hypothetical protein
VGLVQVPGSASEVPLAFDEIPADEAAATGDEHRNYDQSMLASGDKLVWPPDLAEAIGYAGKAIVSFHCPETGLSGDGCLGRRRRDLLQKLHQLPDRASRSEGFDSFISQTVQQLVYTPEFFLALYQLR